MTLTRRRFLSALAVAATSALAGAAALGFGARCYNPHVSGPWTVKGGDALPSGLKADTHYYVFENVDLRAFGELPLIVDVDWTTPELIQAVRTS